MNAERRPVPWLRWAGLLSCWLLALVFLRAAWPKLAQPHAFAEAIYRYHLLPHGGINLLAVYLPWLELACGIALLFVPRLRRGALLLVLLMLVVFTAAIAMSLHRGINIDCGCFSVSREGHHIGWLNLARNAGLMVLVGLGWRGSAKPADPDIA